MKICGLSVFCSAGPNPIKIETTSNIPWLICLWRSILFYFKKYQLVLQDSYTWLLTHWRLVPSIIRLGSMRIVCHNIISYLQRVKYNLKMIIRIWEHLRHCLFKQHNQGYQLIVCVFHTRSNLFHYSFEIHFNNLFGFKYASGQHIMKLVLHWQLVYASEILDLLS